jgi:hypothetical protein
MPSISNPFALSPLRRACGSLAWGLSLGLLLGSCKQEEEAAQQLRVKDPAPDAGEAGAPLLLDAAAEGASSLDARLVAEFCQQMRDAWIERCESEEGEDCASLADDSVTVQVCRATRRAVADGRVRFAAARLQECLDSAALDLADAWERGFIGQGLCDWVFVGTLTLGEACYPDESLQRSCAEGYCVREGQCPGVCSPFAEVGEDCAARRCAPDLYCSAANECVAQALAGESCPDGWGCRAPLVCRDSVCRSLAPLGERCSSERPCTYPGICVRERCLAEVQPGDPCTSPQHCPSGSVCRLEPAGGMDWSCQPPLADGDPCDLRSGCGSNLRCHTEMSPVVGVCEDAPDAAAPSSPTLPGSTPSYPPPPPREPFCAPDL